jgi:hypothetical protein
MTEPTTYDVVLLVEQPLSEGDAAQVRSLHMEVEQPLRYHVLLPVDDAAARVESAMGSMAASEVLASPALVMDTEDQQALQRELLARARQECVDCVGRLQGGNADVSADVVTIDPLDALAAKVAEVDAAEVIVLTRHHVVAEFFHRDWTSRARKRLGVPILHLLAHETFDGQGEMYGGEGVTGL